MKKMISRRNFLKVCAVAGSAVALSACGGSKKAAGPDPSNTDQTSFDPRLQRQRGAEEAGR